MTHKSLIAQNLRAGLVYLRSWQFSRNPLRQQWEMLDSMQVTGKTYEDHIWVESRFDRHSRALLHRIQGD